MTENSFKCNKLFFIICVHVTMTSIGYIIIKQFLYNNDDDDDNNSNNNNNNNNNNNIMFDCLVY